MVCSRIGPYWSALGRCSAAGKMVEKHGANGGTPREMEEKLGEIRENLGKMEENLGKP